MNPKLSNFTSTKEAIPSARKGQFFLWGAVLIVIVFFMGISTFSNKIFPTETGDMGFYSDNIKQEIPKALNFGLNESDGITTLLNFTNFLDVFFADKLITYSSLWVVSEKDGTGANITVGNFMNKDLIITLNISSTSKSLYVSDHHTNYTVFSNVNPDFQLSINYNNQSKTLNLKRDKVNLYVYFNLTRGKQKIIEEITA